MKIGFIGLGNMAKAVMEGVLKAGYTTPDKVFGSAKTSETKEKVAKLYQINTCSNNKEVAEAADVIFLAVKPQFLEEVLSEIYDAIEPYKIVVSMAAGKTLSWLEERLPKETRVIRIMPNTAAIVGESCTAICKGNAATQADLDCIAWLCKSFGNTNIIDEKLMDVYGAIGGASPAFAFLYMEALADGAVANGMPRQMAYEIAAQATMGAAKLMKETKKHPGELKDMVCSPGGTTIEGVSALEKHGLRAGVIAAIRACVEKSRKL